MSTLPMGTSVRFGLLQGWQRALPAFVLLQVWILFLYREIDSFSL